MKTPSMCVWVIIAQRLSLAKLSPFLIVFFIKNLFYIFFSDPDTIIAPRLPNDSVSERGPSPKAFSCRKASNTPDIDFDYGSAIGKSPEECTAYIQ